MIKINMTVVNNGLVFNMANLHERLFCIPPKDREYYDEETNNHFYVNNSNNLEWRLNIFSSNKKVLNRFYPILLTFENNTVRDNYIEEFTTAFNKYTQYLRTKVYYEGKEDKEHIKVGTVIELKGE